MRIGLFFMAMLCFGLSSCRTEEIPITFSFKNDKHVINTDRGRLLVLAETDCAQVENEFGAGFLVSAVEFEDALVDEDRNLCEFINGFEIPDWPEGTQTVVFVGYNVGDRELSLSNCIMDNELSAIRLDIAPRDGFNPNAMNRCATIGERCSGVCPVDATQ